MLGEGIFGALLVFGGEFVEVCCGGHIVGCCCGEGLVESEIEIDLRGIRMGRYARGCRR